MKKMLLLKIAGAVLSLTLLVSCGGSKKAASEKAAFNETGFPIVKEPLTFRVIASKHNSSREYKDMPMFQELEKKTGIHIEWEYSDVDWATKKPLLLASGDLPDILFGRTVVEEGDVIGNMGLFAQLDDLIEKYGVNIKAMFQDDPGMLGFAKAYDGHIYGLPQKMPNRPKAYTTWGINQNWLDKLGLKTPATTEEFYNVLKAFKTRDPNGNGIADEIPYSIQGFNDLAGCMEIFGAFGVVESLNGSWLSVTNGRVNYIAAQDGFKDAIAYLYRLYSEGLIDQEMFTMDWGMWAAKCAPPEGAPEIVGVAPHWSRTLAFGANRVDHHPLLLPLKGPGGDQYWRTNPEFVQGAKYVLEISKNCKNPEIAFRWADAVYDEVFGMELFYGPIGLVIKDNGNGTYEVLLPPEGQDPDQWQWGNAMNDMRPGYNSDSFSAKITDSLSAEQLGDKQRLAAYAPKEYYPLAALTADEQNELATLRIDIHNFAQEQAAAWIVKGGVEKEYDAFVKQLESMGLRRLEEIYQAAYNRYRGK